MSEDKVQVKIEADTSDFQGVLKDAISSLTDSINAMKSSFNDLAGSIKDSIGKAADSTKDAAKNISGGIKESMSAAVSTVSEAATAMSGDITGSMQQTTNETSQATKSMAENVQRSTENMTSSFVRLNNMIGSIGIGIVGIFGSAAKETIAYEKSLLGLSRTSGLSIESTSRLAYAASQYGLTTEDLGQNVGILSRNLAVLEKDTDSATNVFNRFGIDVHDSNGNLLSADQIILNVADKFKSMPDGVNKTALSMALFGRQGQNMIPMLNQGSKGIQKLGKDAEKLGLVFKDVAALKAYTMATKQYNATMKSLQMQLGNAVLPILTAFSKAITNVLKAFNQLNPTFKTTVVTTAAVAGSVAALTLGWGAAATAIATFGGPFARVGTMMQKMPNVVTAAAGGVKSLVVGMTNATIATAKYILTGGLFTTANNAMKATSIAAATAMHGVRTAVLATSLAFSTGGIKSVISYGASLIGMNGVVKVARMGLMLLYGTVTAGIAVVAALAFAWTGNFGNIHEATAGTCDGIIFGLNNFADGVSQICSGIGKIFTSLALTIGKALVGDFSGAIDEAKGLLDGIKNVGVGAFGAMKGFGQAIYGAASDPEGTMKFGKAALGALKKGASDMMGFGDQPEPDIPGDGMGGFDGPGGGGGADRGGDKGGGQEESAYEKAKKLYEQQIQLAEYSAAEKEALYKKYLASVKKSDQELVDYKIGLYGLEKTTFAEMLHEQEVKLENDKIQGKITEQQYVADIAEIKRKNLDAEVEFRAKAAMEVANLTEMEKIQQIGAYKEKVKATIWYKESLKEVLNAEKTLSDYQISIANKLANYRKQMALNAISTDEKRLQALYEQETITQEQLLTAQKDIEERRYVLEKESLEKSLENCAINVDKMKKTYEKYVNARDEATKEMLANEMRLNGKSEEDVISVLEQLEILYTQYTHKQSDLDKDLKKEKIKNLEQVRDSMKDTMSQAFQDVLTKSTTFLGVLKNVFSSTMKTILKQFTDTIARSITTKGFKNKINDLVEKPKINPYKSGLDKTQIIAEQAKQTQLTAITAQGDAQRRAIKATSDQQEVTMTATTTEAEKTMHITADQTISASAQMSGQTAVQSIQASLQAMIQMLPTLLIMSALTRLFSGGGTKTTESTGPGINLGRNPDSYYQTPTLYVPSFDVGSWRLPADTLAMVHAGEMIVPAKGGLADNMRSMLESGGGQSSSPTFNLSYSAAHYGRTNRDVQNEMKQNAKFLVKALNSEYRNFNRGKV